MLDKILEIFRKVDRTMSSVESMQRTAERVEYQAGNVSAAGSRKWKWVILAVIVAVAVLYAVFS